MTDEFEEATRRRAFIASLRAAADFLERHPDVRAPRYVTMNVFVETREDLAVHARAATWEKIFNGQWVYLRRTFGDDLVIDITAPRETVCRKVVVGVETIPAHEEERVEWVCDDPVLLTSEGK